MSNDSLSKSKLKNMRNIDKIIELKNINVNNVSIEDLDLRENNYDEFINLKNLLDNISSCQLSDAYNNLFGKKGTIKGLRSINDQKVFGRITTVETSSDDWGTGIVAIDFVGDYKILFIKSNNCDFAIWGELASYEAKNHGVRGVGIYGSVRDMDAISNLDLPIFALDHVPNAGKPAGLGNINCDLSIDGEIIRSGDFFFGDKTGSVVIPAIVFNKVMIETLRIKLDELAIIDMMNKKESLIDIIDLNDSIRLK